ncbi:sigma-70 family RNA polymerase sigma factor [Pontiellaceae bacterium B1224]|nr:sigma-70 family RNA polymerase sigma factor [Pontiellaceae bacterium B1224]
MSSSDHTRYSLLQRAHDTDDEEAWKQFVLHYRRFIAFILRQIGVRENDVEDLTQQILLNLTQKLSTYDRSRSSFRTWLGHVIRNAAKMHFRRQSSRPVEVYETHSDFLINGILQESDVDRLISTEWEDYIATQALDRVRQTFKGKAVDVFEMGLEGLSAPEIAEQTGLTVPSVYKLRTRVKRKLFLEVRALTEELEG